MNRRTFIGLAAGLTTAFPTLSRPHFWGANNRLNIGLIGCRSMGWWNLVAALKQANVKCVGLADVDQKVLDEKGEEVKKIQGATPKLYADYRQLLDDKDLDAVIIGTPDHWHCLQFVDACKAGKDVYVEKPIGNSIAECEVMERAASKYKRVAQVGQIQRSGLHWKEMVNFIQAGKLGTIAKADVWANFKYASLPRLDDKQQVPPHVDYERWLGPAPQREFSSQRFHGSWRMFWDYGGGLMTDWGVHLLDMVLWAKDIKELPEQIIGTGANRYMPNGGHETYDTQGVSYVFPDFVMNWENNAGLERGPFDRPYGVAFYGTNGILVGDRDSWTILSDKQGGQLKLEEQTIKSDHQEHQRHVADFIDAVRNRRFETACPIQVGSLAARFAHMGNIVARTGEGALRYNANKRTFNSTAANQLIQPKYRAPYTFPKV